MFPTFKKLWVAGAFVAASSLLAPVASAQKVVTLTVQSFDLAGAGCPAKAGTTVTLGTAPSGTPQFTIKFPTGSAAGVAPAPAPVAAPGTTPTTVPATFSVSGANAQSACTVAITVGAAGAPKADLKVVSSTATVVASNPGNQGQLSLTQRVRVNATNSASRTSSITPPMAAAAGSAAQPINVMLNNINVSSEVTGTGTLLVNLQLQTVNAGPNASVTMDSYKTDVTASADVSG